MSVRPSLLTDVTPTRPATTSDIGPFADAPPDAQTVAVELGGRVDATFGGGPEHPEDRAVHAFDGDPVTAWRPGLYPVGQWVQVHLDRAKTAASYQAPHGARRHADHLGRRHRRRDPSGRGAR